MSEIRRIWTFRVIRAFAVEEAGSRLHGAPLLPLRPKNIEPISILILKDISLALFLLPSTEM